MSLSEQREFVNTALGIDAEREWALASERMDIDIALEKIEQSLSWTITDRQRDSVRAILAGNL